MEGPDPAAALLLVADLMVEWLDLAAVLLLEANPPVKGPDPVAALLPVADRGVEWPDPLVALLQMVDSAAVGSDLAPVLLSVADPAAAASWAQIRCWALLRRRICTLSAAALGSESGGGRSR